MGGIFRNCPAGLSNQLRPTIEWLVPAGRLLGDDLTHKIAADQARTGLRLGYQTGVVLIRRGEDPVHGPLNSQASDEGSRVDTFDPNDSVAVKIIGQLSVRTEVACSATSFFHDKAGQVRLSALDVLRVDAVIADLRIRHRHDLTAIARVRENLLITGHRRIEADFTVHFSVGAEGSSCEHRSIL